MATDAVPSALAFHLAFPTSDLEATRQFFTQTLGFDVGRTSARWVDFNICGHQITAHLTDSPAAQMTNPVDGEQVPAFHFGLVLDWKIWQLLADRLKDHDCAFIIPPTIRFAGKPAEQATMFVREPGGNALEFKAMRHPENLFTSQ